MSVAVCRIISIPAIGKTKTAAQAAHFGSVGARFRISPSLFRPNLVNNKGQISARISKQQNRKILIYHCGKKGGFHANNLPYHDGRIIRRFRG
jgi:hypothetical protein